MVKLFLPNSGYQSSVKIAKITYRKQFSYITAGAADSRTKTAFMKFVHANAIESYLTDSLIWAERQLKSITLKKFEIYSKN